MAQLNDTTKKVIKELRDIVERLENEDSNISVAWKLEGMYLNDWLLEKSKEIKRSLKH